MKALPLWIWLAGCAVESPPPATLLGTYQVHRMVTNFEPSPDFNVPSDYQIDLATDHVTIDANTMIDGPAPVIAAPHVTLDGSEQWTSSDGEYDPAVHYELSAGGTDELTGTAVASGPFDTPQGFHDFEFDFAIKAHRIAMP